MEENHAFLPFSDHSGICGNRGMENFCGKKR